MHKLFLDNLLLINHSNMFRPLNRSHHQGARNPWELQSLCIDLKHAIKSSMKHILITRIFIIYFKLKLLIK